MGIPASATGLRRQLRAEPSCNVSTGHGVTLAGSAALAQTMAVRRTAHPPATAATARLRHRPRSHRRTRRRCRAPEACDRATRTFPPMPSRPVTLQRTPSTSIGTRLAGIPRLESSRLRCGVRQPSSSTRRSAPATAARSSVPIATVTWCSSARHRSSRIPKRRPTRTPRREISVPSSTPAKTKPVTADITTSVAEARSRLRRREHRRSFVA